MVLTKLRPGTPPSNKAVVKVHPVVDVIANISKFDRPANHKLGVRPPSNAEAPGVRLSFTQKMICGAVVKVLAKVMLKVEDVVGTV